MHTLQQNCLQSCNNSIRDPSGISRTHPAKDGTASNRKQSEQNAATVKLCQTQRLCLTVANYVSATSQHIAGRSEPDTAQGGFVAKYANKLSRRQNLYKKCETTKYLDNKIMVSKQSTSMF
jgi:hypothetical protein